MKKIRLTESDLVNIIKRVVSEQKDKVTSQFRPLVNLPKMESMEMNEGGPCIAACGNPCAWPSYWQDKCGCKCKPEMKESQEMNEAGQPCPPPTVGIRPNCVVLTKEGPYRVTIL